MPTHVKWKKSRTASIEQKAEHSANGVNCGHYLESLAGNEFSDHVQ